MPTSVRRRITSAALTVLLGSGAAGCSNTSEPRFVGPPPLPETGSVRPELSLFLDFAGAAGTNFMAAVQIVETANTATTASLSLPIVLLDGAQAETPVSQSDGYHWNYSVTSGGLLADVDMKARARGVVDALWEMRVNSSSASPPLADFVLMTGEHDLLGISGKWRFFDPTAPSTPTPLLDITWETDGLSWRVVFKNVEAGAAAIGDYLEYQSVADLRRVFYNDFSTGALSIIDWNADTNVGSITSPGFNGDQKACWSATLANVAC